ncbi:hypothetical protein [Microvirga vignae]|nr:hypothetical protein [Microvirga vignae]
MPSGGGIHSINKRRLLDPIGNVPPAEAEGAYYAQLEVMPMAA